jgi:hypothetical protein
MLAERAHRPFADSRAAVGIGCRSGAGTRSVPHGESFAFGIRQAQADGAIGEADGEAAAPEFVELVAPQTGGLSECLIELGGRHGKMRIQWKGTTAPDLAGLSRALWERK